MSIKRLRPIPGEPVEVRRTPRCEADTANQNEFQANWRIGRAQTEERYIRGSNGSKFQCVRPSVVKINRKHYCRLHAGHLVLNMYLEGKLIEA